MIFVGAVAVVLALFFSISGEEKTRPVPDDPTHQSAYRAAYRDAPAPGAPLLRRAFFRPDRKEAEKLCEPCHRERGVPFPPKHPPKNRCLFCHKLLPR